MGSSSPRNTHPWQPPPYYPYRGCSLGICTIYCPQWCMFFPPPPESSGSGTYFSPLVISVIVILVGGFLLVSYFTVFKKSCDRRSQQGRNPQSGHHVDVFLRSASPVGLDESAIESIAVYKYKKGEGLVEAMDCSVCLSEFQNDESLRLLPKCHHAFHLPCIDTWLKSHSNCPICRADVSPTVNSSPPCELPSTVLSSPSPTDHDYTSTGPAAPVSVDSVTAVRRDQVITTVIRDVETAE